MTDIILEPMPQPFTVYGEDGQPIFRDAISYADRHGKTAAQLKVIAEQRYEDWQTVIATVQEEAEIPDGEI